MQSPTTASGKGCGGDEREQGNAVAGNPKPAEAAASNQPAWTLRERLIWRAVGVCNSFGIYSRRLSLVLDRIVERRDRQE